MDYKSSQSCGTGSENPVVEIHVCTCCRTCNDLRSPLFSGPESCYTSFRPILSQWHIFCVNPTIFVSNMSDFLFNNLFRRWFQRRQCFFCRFHDLTLFKKRKRFIACNFHSWCDKTVFNLILVFMYSEIKKKPGCTAIVLQYLLEACRAHSIVPEFIKSTKFN